MPVRLGFVGCGGIAAVHFNALSQIEDARPVAFCDVDPARAEAAARRFEGSTYPTPAAMLEAGGLDAVYVCLPPHVHGETELLVARAGCALFVEKPLSNTLKVAEKIAGAVENARILAVAGYHWRYYESVVRVQKLLGAKGAAQPAMAYARWLGGFPGVPWWRKLEQSGGQIVEQTTHILDLSRLLCGEVRRVSCVAALREMDKQHQGTTAPDVSCLLMEFASGAIGYSASASLLGPLGEVGLTLYARETVYEIRDNTLTVKTPGETHITSGTNNAYLEEDRAFVQAVKTGRRTGVKSTYADALKTLRLTLAANQSAKTGKPVMV